MTQQTIKVLFRSPEGQCNPSTITVAVLGEKLVYDNPRTFDYRVYRPLGISEMLKGWPGRNGEVAVFRGSTRNDVLIPRAELQRIGFAA
jgi:hypothetical protein